MEGFDLEYIKKKELDEGMNPTTNNNSQPNKQIRISIEELLKALDEGNNNQDSIKPKEDDIYEAFIRSVEEDSNEKGHSK
jgi:hypothetical protein